MVTPKALLTGESNGDLSTSIDNCTPAALLTSDVVFNGDSGGTSFCGLV